MKERRWYVDINNNLKPRLTDEEKRVELD